MEKLQRQPTRDPPAAHRLTRPSRPTFRAEAGLSVRLGDRFDALGLRRGEGADSGGGKAELVRRLTLAVFPCGPDGRHLTHLFFLFFP